MKVYVTADIEGVPGVASWGEAAEESGADEILVRDAHDSGRNIDYSALPERVRLARGWSDDPRCMAQELDHRHQSRAGGQAHPSGSIVGVCPGRAGSSLCRSPSF